MLVKFQISLEFVVLVIFLMVGSVGIYFVVSSTLPVSDVNETTRSVLQEIKGPGAGNISYNITQEYLTNLTILGMVVSPDGYDVTFDTMNYSVTFLATKEKIKTGEISEGSSYSDSFGDEDFTIRHVSYSDGIVNYRFESSVIEDYLS